MRRAGFPGRQLRLFPVLSGSRVAELSRISRRGLGVKRILNDYMDPVYLQTLVLQGLLQKLKIIFKIGFYSARICADPCRNSMGRVFSPDFKTSEAIRFQLDTNLAFPVPQLNAYLICQLEI